MYQSYICIAVVNHLPGREQLHQLSITHYLYNFYYHNFSLGALLDWLLYLVRGSDTCMSDCKLFGQHGQRLNNLVTGKRVNWWGHTECCALTVI
ncbi:hypothetical protein XELAEV_18027551mg [Xenopus laevis]|uniref:Uncharacterized protein n=1 Tax=Xenopus laevis TaxID=8355 RepID=A0A974CWM1_XENLA|nr:hypothetical protein XELAEV_18027551mg [Xenopus laevis]